MNRHYIYCYLDPTRPGEYHYDGLDICFLYEPFYIGRGCGDRFIDHIKDVIKGRKISNRIKNSKISKILDIGLYPFIEKIENNISINESINKEIFYIKSIGRIDIKNGPLSNLTSGGDGMLEMSPYLRKHYSILFSGEGNPMFGVSRFGEDNPFFGKKHSKESKLKISNSVKNKIPWNKGIKHSKISGEKHTRVVDYYLISPNNEVFKIKSCYLKEIYKEKSLSDRCLRRYLNKGKIPPYNQGKDLLERVNTTGWEIKTMISPHQFPCSEVK